MLVIAPLDAGLAVDVADAEGIWKRGVPEAFDAVDVVVTTEDGRDTGVECGDGVVTGVAVEELKLFLIFITSDGVTSARRKGTNS